MKGTQSHRKVTDDLLLEILSRLPVKSLVHCKLVSKTWHALILLGQRQNKLPRVMSGLFYHSYVWGSGCWKYVIKYVSTQSHDDGNPADTDLGFLPCSQRRIVDCSNGLLLCHSWETNTSSYYVCNPASKKWAKLPKPDYRLLATALDFDPRSQHYIVLGLRMERISDSMTYIPLSFSSETRRWVEKRVPSGFGRHSYNHHAFLNGNIHVIAYGEPVVIAVDMERETCRRIELPGSKELLDYANGCVGQSQGCLHYAQKRDNQTMQVWVLSDYGRGEWSLKHSIDVQALVEKQAVLAAPMCPYLIHVRAFHPDFDVVFVRMHPKLFSYHLVSGELSEIPVEGEDTRGFYPYTPCLLEDMDL